LEETFDEEFAPKMGEYDVALICRSGHRINTSFRRFPQGNTKFCSECGAPAMWECEGCKSPIRGAYHAKYAFGLYEYDLPNFCHSCGSDYPWMIEKLEAARELVQELELAEEDKRTLTQSLDDVVRDTPKTEVASLRIRRLLTKAGQEGAGALKAILIQIATSAAKQQMGLP
jgi:hypothetical protein